MLWLGFGTAAVQRRRSIPVRSGPCVHRLSIVTRRCGSLVGNDEESTT